MHDICLIQVLDYEAQNYLNKKNKKVLECKNCPIKDNCKRALSYDRKKQNAIRSGISKQRQGYRSRFYKIETD